MVLVSSLIAVLVIFSFSQFLNDAGKKQASIQNGVDFQIIKASMLQILESPSLCDGAFRDATGNPVLLTTGSLPVNISKIMLGPLTFLDIVNKPELGGGLKLTKMRFTQAVPDGSVLIGPTTYDRYMAALEIEVKKSDQALKNSESSKEFFFRIYTRRPTGAVEKCVAQAPVAVGTISAFALGSCPVGWKLADGSVLNKSDYGDLWKAIEDSGNAASATLLTSSTIKLPNLQGEFIRGAAAGAQIGVVQAQSTQLKSHTHGGNMFWGGTAAGTAANPRFAQTVGEGHEHCTTDSAGNVSCYGKTTAVYSGVIDTPTLAAGDTDETRPRNTSVLYCIKY